MFYFLDRTLDFGFIIFTILSPTPRNKDAAESALPTIAPFLAATRSASAFARWLVTGLMVGRDGAAPSWTPTSAPPVMTMYEYNNRAPHCPFNSKACLIGAAILESLKLATMTRVEPEVDFFLI